MEDTYTTSYRHNGKTHRSWHVSTYRDCLWGAPDWVCKPSFAAEVKQGGGTNNAVVVRYKHPHPLSGLVQCAARGDWIVEYHDRFVIMTNEAFQSISLAEKTTGTSQKQEG